MTIVTLLTLAIAGFVTSLAQRDTDTGLAVMVNLPPDDIWRTPALPRA